MGPKKNKKRNDDQDDELFNKKQKQVQQMLNKVAKANNKKKNHFQNINDDEDQDINFNRKQAFDWQVSQQHLKTLQKIQQKKQKQFKQKQQQQLQAKKLTPQQQQQRKRKLEKQNKQKEKKEKKKQEKKAERLKQIEEQKVQQQKIKQEEEKQTQEVEKKLKTPVHNGKCLPIFFVVFIISLCALQYQKQIYLRLSKFKIQSEDNYYETLQIDSGATDRQLKEKYKRLVLKYHPDKNPNCKDCQAKFNTIIKAWQVLGSPEKRKHYDANSGFVTQIKSQSITLTPSNYEQLVEGSKSLWMIQVYDSTQKYCHYFAQFWQQFIQQYGEFIKFGRVDVWTQTDMLSYMPYKFQVFPSVYYYHKGEIELCQFDFQKPDSSVRRCIQSQYKDNQIQKISNTDQIKHNDKVSIVFTQKVKIGSIFKIINKKYESDVSFYLLTEKHETHQIIAILPNKEKQIFSLNPKQVGYYEKYQKFLESLFVQKITTCELISKCQNQACFVLINDHKQKQSSQHHNLPCQNPQQARPVFLVQDQQFYHALNDLKNKTDMTQKFNLGLYQNGHIDLGYIDEAKILNPEQGQNFQQLHCVYKDNSFIGNIKSIIQKLINML